MRPARKFAADYFRLTQTEEQKGVVSIINGRAAKNNEKKIN
jgi:hypothetical protein